MIGKRIEKVLECIRLSKDEYILQNCYRLFWVSDLINGFNINMTKLLIVDESMVAFYNKYEPGWVAVKRKPQ